MRDYLDSVYYAMYMHCRGPQFSCIHFKISFFAAQKMIWNSHLLPFKKHMAITQPLVVARVG